MILNTKHFGEIEIDENKIITFEDGIPGFENFKKFIVVLSEDGAEDVFCWLQSVDDGDTALPMINIYAVKPDYEPKLPKEEMELLGEFKVENIMVYNIVVIPDDIKDLTVNLIAPVVINVETRKGKQFICINTNYSMRHRLMDEIKKGK